LSAPSAKPERINKASSLRYSKARTRSIRAETYTRTVPRTVSRCVSMRSNQTLHQYNAAPAFLLCDLGVTSRRL
jgi:hypothetical protein